MTQVEFISRRRPPSVRPVSRRQAAAAAKVKIDATLRPTLERLEAFYRVPPSLILGRGRAAAAVGPRQILYWVLRAATRASYPRIGAALNRDHSTIIKACQQIDRARIECLDTRDKTDRLFEAALEDVARARLMTRAAS